jgi:hypothetical protein
MEMLCPECMGAMVSTDGQTARCTVHGGEYRVLFSRQPIAAPATVPATPPEWEPGIAADDSTLPVITDQPDMAAAQVCAMRCLQHPNVAAVQVCKSCGAPMCGTCDFLLPGNIHVCPRCVAAPPKGLSGKRKRLLYTAYGFAVWNTLGLALLMSGVLASEFQTKEKEQILGVIYSVFLWIPSLIGAALGISCLDRRLRNPGSVWGAVIWTCILLGIHIVLVVIGNFSK